MSATSPATWLQNAGGQRGIDAVEQLQKDQADRVTRGRQAIAAGARQLLDQAFGAQFGEVVAQRGQAVLLAAAAQGGGDVWMNFAGAESVGGGI